MRKTAADTSARRKRKRPAAFRQPRVKGESRAPRATALLRRIDDAVEREMIRYGKSRSYVLAVCAAIALNIELPAGHDYHKHAKRGPR